jgi:hypothetical protein
MSHQAATVKRGARRNVVLVLCLALLLSLSMLSRSAVAAEQECGSGGNWFDGFNKSPSSTYLSWGVSADIVVRSTALCGTRPNSEANFSVAWAMIFANDGEGYAQSGTFRATGGTSAGYTHHYAEWDRSVNNPGFTRFHHYQHLFDGERHQYWVPYVNSRLQMRVDATTFLTTNFDPNGDWAGPWITAYYGESYYHGTDVPGRTSAKLAFGSMQSQSSPTTWESQRCGMVALNEIPSRWDQVTYGCNSRAVWTWNP